MALASTITAAPRGIGDSRTAMIYNLTANAVNVVFNYLLINDILEFPGWRWTEPPLLPSWASLWPLSWP